MKTVGAHLAALLARESRLRSDVLPFLRYVALLVSVVLLYAWLFHLIMAREGQEYSWFTGVYWALTVMTTLGFGDITFHSDLGRLFSTVVLLTGVVLLLIVFPFLFIRNVYTPWQEQRSRARLRAIRAVPPEVSGHVIVCANDPIALALVRRLAVAGVGAYVIEPDAEVALRMRDAGVPALAGDVDACETYTAGRVGAAKLVLANSTDAENTNIILTVRERAEDVPIVAIAESDDSIDIMEMSGATHVLPLKRQLGEHLANRVSAGLARANVIGRMREFLLVEFPVHDSPLQGQTIGELALQESFGIAIVGVWRSGRLHAARPDVRLTPRCVPVAIGTPEQVQELNELLVIYNVNPSPVIVLGGGVVGSAAVQTLKSRGVKVNLVERAPALAGATGIGADRLIVGDAADRRVLADAGIEEAPAIVLTTHDDAMNVYLTVYCRRLNPSARILTRVTHERNVEAILRAGADFVLSYASLGVQCILAMVQEREPVILAEGVDLFHIQVPRALVHRTLADAAVGERCGLNVIALLESDRLLAVPTADTRLAEGMSLIAIGSALERDRFQQAFG